MSLAVLDFHALRTKRGGLEGLEAKLLNYAQQAIVATDLEGNSIYWNRPAERIFGWTSSTILQCAGASDVLPKIFSGQSWSGVAIASHQVGSSVQLRLRADALFDNWGNVAGIVWVSAESMQASEIWRTSVRKKVESVRTFLLALGQGAVPFSKDPDVLRGSAYAVLLYLGALGIRILLNKVVPGQVPFVGFWPAILFAAFISGFWPTLGLLFASAATMALWGGRPQEEPLSFHLLLVLLFLLIGAALVVPIFYLKTVQEQLRRHDERMAIINEELRHRLRNLFAVVGAVCRHSLNSKQVPEQLGKSIGGRIQALAAAQDLLTVTSKGCELHALVEKVIKPLAPDNTRLRTQGPDVLLPAEATTQFALILHELATNALKHGAWNPKDQGRVSIEWCTRVGGELEFEWTERCTGQLKPKPTQQGFGSVLIKSGFNRGKVSHQIKPSGVECRIECVL